MSRNPYHHNSAAGSERELVDGKSWSGADRFAEWMFFEERNALQVKVGQGGIPGDHHNHLGVLGALKSHWEQIIKQRPELML